MRESDESVKDTEPPPSGAMVQAIDAFERALEKGSWNTRDRDSLASLMPAMSETEKNTLRRRLASAISERQLDVRIPPYL